MCRKIIINRWFDVSRNIQIKRRFPIFCLFVSFFCVFVCKIWVTAGFLFYLNKSNSVKSWREHMQRRKILNSDQKHSQPNSKIVWLVCQMPISRHSLVSCVIIKIVDWHQHCNDKCNYKITVRRGNAENKIQL